MRAFSRSAGQIKIVQRSLARRKRDCIQDPVRNQQCQLRVTETLVQPFSAQTAKKTYFPWLDKKLPPETRVNRFLEVELGQLGWRAVSLDSVELAERCCRYQDFVGMKMAESVLDRAVAEKRYVDSNRHSPDQPPFKIPILLFQKILFGWACLTTKGAMAQDRMRELMDLLIQVAKEEEERFNSVSASVAEECVRLQPTTALYNTYLIGLRNAAEVSPKAAIIAREVLDEMISLHQKHGWHTKPNTKSYTFVIKAFANSKLKDAGPEAEKVLKRMKMIHEEEKQAYQSEVGTPYNTDDPAANKRMIVTADEIAYSYVIQAYSQDPSLKSAVKTRDLLMEVMNKEDGTVKANFALVTGVIAAYAKLAENVRVSKATRLTAAQHAEEVLEMFVNDMHSLNKSKRLRNRGDVSFVAPFNASMNAYARCGAIDSALKAESILQRLLADFTEGRSLIHPDTISFNTVLQGWARSTLPEAPKKAEELMKLQMQLVASGVLPRSAMPDVQTFVTVMTAYSRSHEPDKVHQTYRLLQDLVQRISDGNIVPDSNLVIAFTAVLDAAAYPAHPKLDEKPSSCRDESGPSAMSSDFLLPTHASCSDEYTTALRAYRELKDDIYQLGCKPDHFAFAKMINVIGTHTDTRSAERRQMLQLVFGDASAAGEVSKLVLKYLLKVCPDKDFLAYLLQSEDLASRDVETVDELPRQWTRNVPRNFRHMKREPSYKRRFKS